VHLRRFFSGLLCLSIGFYGAPVGADETAATESPEVRLIRSAELRLAGPLLDVPRQFTQASTDQANSNSDLQARIASLLADKAEIDTASPRRAVIAGSVLLGVGALIAGSAAIACAQANSGSDTTCREERAEGLEIGGGAVAGIGLVTLIAGLTARRNRREEIREIDRKINGLVGQRASISRRLEARLTLGKTTHLGVSWRF
jgi:hypothetical protein